MRLLSSSMVRATHLAPGFAHAAPMLLSLSLPSPPDFLDFLDFFLCFLCFLCFFLSMCLLGRPAGHTNTCTHFNDIHAQSGRRTVSATVETMAVSVTSTAAGRYEQPAASDAGAERAAVAVATVAAVLAFLTLVRFVPGAVAFLIVFARVRRHRVSTRANCCYSSFSVYCYRSARADESADPHAYGHAAVRRPRLPPAKPAQRRRTQGFIYL